MRKELMAEDDFYLVVCKVGQTLQYIPYAGLYVAQIPLFPTFSRTINNDGVNVDSNHVTVWGQKPRSHISDRSQRRGCISLAGDRAE